MDICYIIAVYGEKSFWGSEGLFLSQYHEWSLGVSEIAGHAGDCVTLEQTNTV